MIVCVRERMIIPPSQDTLVSSHCLYSSKHMHDTQTTLTPPNPPHRTTYRLTTTLPFLAYLRMCFILALVVFIRRRR